MLGQRRIRVVIATIKAEWIDRQGWYNTRRRHSSLGYLSPNAYEMSHHTTDSAADAEAEPQDPALAG
jgi:transposase InsO family protein